MEEGREIVVAIAKEKQTGRLDFHRYLVDKKLADEREPSLLRAPKNSGKKDGVHLTSEGYERLTKLVAKKLSGLKFDTPRVVCFGDSINHGGNKESAKTVTAPNYPAYLKQILNDQGRSRPNALLEHGLTPGRISIFKVWDAEDGVRLHGREGCRPRRPILFEQFALPENELRPLMHPP